MFIYFFFFFSSRRRHTRSLCDWSSDVCSSDLVTGKPVVLGGSLGRREATGRGVMICTRETARHLEIDMRGATVAVQGFGNVGSVSADLISKLAARIVAVTDW